MRTLCGGECDRFSVDFLAGVRWFRFQDGFVFGAERGSDGTTYADNWLYLNDHITNDLYRRADRLQRQLPFCRLLEGLRHTPGRRLR